MTPRAVPSASQVRLAFLLTSLGGLLFTFDLPLLRLSGADQWTMVFTRGIFLFVAITTAWAFARSYRRERTPFIDGWAGLTVVLTSTVGNMAYIGAVVQTDAANVVFIIALTPVIAATLSRLVLGERVHPFTWIATIVAFIGAGVIVRDGLQGGHAAGDMLAFLSAFCSASALTIIRASGKNVATSFGVGSLFSALLAVTLFGAAPLSLGAAGGFGLPAWMWLALNGLIAMPLATLFLARGPRVLPSADVSMFFMLETVLTPLWIWLLFAEAPSPAVIVGGCIIIFTLLAHSWWRLTRSLRTSAVTLSQ